jgi:hypothetical protein
MIDLRFMLLKPKLERINDTYKTETENYDIINFDYKGYSSFQMAVFLKAVNEVYGENIDNQMEIRFCIDSLFERNATMVKIQFVVFVVGFLMPFMIQILNEATNNLVVGLNVMCMITQILFLT